MRDLLYILAVFVAVVLIGWVTIEILVDEVGRAVVIGLVTLMGLPA